MYEKSYSSNHTLLRLLQNWKKFRYNKNFVDAVLMDLSKAFDCIPHNLLAVKLHIHRLSEDAITFVHSYLKLRKQGVKINGTESVFSNTSIRYTTRFYFMSHFIQYLYQ